MSTSHTIRAHAQEVWDKSDKDSGWLSVVKKSGNPQFKEWFVPDTHLYFFRYDPREVIKAYIGVNDHPIASNGINTNLKRYEHDVEEVIKHEKWDGSGSTFPDLALIKLADKVNFKIIRKTGQMVDDESNYSLLPACLPDLRNHADLYDSEAFVAGTYLQIIRIHF